MTRPEITLVPATQAAALLRLLRPALSDATFDQRLKAAVNDGYKTFIARLDGVDVGVLGFHITHDVCWGATLYVDDLVVDPDRRGNRIGRALMEAARAYAGQERCDIIRLCSGMSRHDAHRFYEGFGMTAFSKQFVLPLNEG